MTAGFFITFEGIEGVGKSTQLAQLQAYLSQCPIKLCVTREPGGTPLAEAMRDIALSRHDEALASDAEILLMFAARAQHLTQVIRPALAQGAWVLCDRFTDASYAYQGGGRGIAVEKIAALEHMVQGDLVPDLTFVLDMPAEQALHRAKHRKALDRIEQESLDFFERVRAVYLKRAAQYPQRYHVIDASQPINTIHTQIRAVIDAILSQRGIVCQNQP